MYINCHTYFSLKYGALSVKQLLENAQHYGIHQLALTDINNTSGVLDFVRLAPKYGVQPIVGIDFRNGNKQQFIGIAQNNTGFMHLNAFLSACSTTGRVIIPHEPPQLEHTFMVLPFLRLLEASAQELTKWYQFLHNNPRAFIGVGARQLNKLKFSGFTPWLSRMVILQSVTFAVKKDFNAHRLLRAMAYNTLLSKLPTAAQAHADDMMFTPQQLEEMYSDFPMLVHHTRRLLESCSIRFDFGVNQNKQHFTDSAQSDHALLRSLCLQGLHYRYRQPTPDILARIEKEIELIIRLNFASYFLINHDIVSFARHHNYFYIGRGSGANSIVAYLLGITDVDPVELDLYFERFLNPYRTSPPDFDLDFSWKDRDAILRHIFKTHGTAHTCLLATYSTLQANAVMRELGKVFGLPKAEIDELQENRKKREQPDSITRLIYIYSNYLNDFPSHLSIHAGGVLIAERPIHYYTATHMPPKGFPTSQFSMLEAEDVGLYKFDILSQRGLGHIKDAVSIIKENKGIDIDIHDIKQFKEDKAIKQLLREGRCMGCFYVESPAMRMLLKKLGADTYRALVAASSIIRPGVAASGMMREYILRFKGMQPGYQTPESVYRILKETFGVMVYQEDVIKIAHYYAGMGLGEADMLRRGMSGKYRGREEFEKVRQLFFDGCNSKGYPEYESREVWRQIESFAGYAFSKGHSASYAVESYMSLYLKAHHPLEHMVAVINNFGGFYQTEYYVHEARMHGAVIEAPNINKSDLLSTIDGKTIYLGFIHVAELEQQSITELLRERNAHGDYQSFSDFAVRVPLSTEQMRILIRVGAFDKLGVRKKNLLWDLHLNTGAQAVQTPIANLFEPHNTTYTLPPLEHHTMDDVMDQIAYLGFSLQSPFTGIELPADAGPVAADLPLLKGKKVSIAGYLVTVKYTRTKHRDEMLFATFLDLNGCFFDTVHFPAVAKTFPLRGKGCYMIRGTVAEEFDFYSINTESIEKLQLARIDELM